MADSGREVSGAAEKGFERLTGEALKAQQGCLGSLVKAAKIEGEIGKAVVRMLSELERRISRLEALWVLHNGEPAAELLEELDRGT